MDLRHRLGLEIAHRAYELAAGVGGQLQQIAAAPLACELLHDGQDGEGRARLEESMAADPSVWPLLPMMTSMGLKIVERYDEAGEVLDTAATHSRRGPAWTSVSCR